VDVHEVVEEMGEEGKEMFQVMASWRAALLMWRISSGFEVLVLRRAFAREATDIFLVRLLILKSAKLRQNNENIVPDFDFQS